MITIERRERTKPWKGSEIQPVTRVAIWLRGDRRCAWCGVELDRATLQIDHRVPRSQGGTNSRSNLIPSCGGCNHLAWWSPGALDERLLECGTSIEAAVARIAAQIAIPIDRAARDAARPIAREWYPWLPKRDARDRRNAKRRMRTIRAERSRANKRAEREGLGGISFPFGELGLAKTKPRGPGLAKCGTGKRGRVTA